MPRLTEEQLRELRGKVAASQLNKLKVVAGKLMEHLGRFEVGTPQAVVLLSLLSHGPMEPSQIAENTLIPRQTMTSVLDRLETKYGYIVREDHPCDRRRKIISLTEAGEGVAYGMWQDMDAYEAKIMGVLKASEIKFLNGVTAKIGARLREVE